MNDRHYGEYAFIPAFVSSSLKNCIMSKNPLFQENPAVWFICAALIVGFLVCRAMWMHNVEQRPKELKTDLDDLKKIVESQRNEIDRLKQERDDLKRNR